jgi:hypothetical protein
LRQPRKADVPARTPKGGACPGRYYFEWCREDGRKQKFEIGTALPFTMAGLFRLEPGEILPRFVI